MRYLSRSPPISRDLTGRCDHRRGCTAQDDDYKFTLGCNYILGKSDKKLLEADLCQLCPVYVWPRDDGSSANTEDMFTFELLDFVPKTIYFDF